jgi:hypothetical protein
MRRIVICSGVLGGGTALVFALAALTATLFPHGTIVPTNQFGWGGGPMVMNGVRIGPAIEDVAPAIAVPAPMVIQDDFGGFPDPGAIEEEGKP